MERDEWKKNRLLFSTPTGLYSATLDGKSFDTLAETDIPGFLQVHPDLVLFLGRQEHKILSIDRTKNVITQVAGHYPYAVLNIRSGKQNASSATFDILNSIIFKPQHLHQFYVSDSRSIKELDLDQETVEIVYTGCASQLSKDSCMFMLVDANSLMYISGKSQVAVLNITQQNPLILKDNSLSVLNFVFRGASGMVSLESAKTLLIAEKKSNKLRVVNLAENNSISSICSDTNVAAPFAAINIQNCSLLAPQSLLKWTDELVLVGTTRGLYQLSGGY